MWLFRRKPRIQVDDNTLAGWLAENNFAAQQAVENFVIRDLSSRQLQKHSLMDKLPTGDLENDLEAWKTWLQLVPEPNRLSLGVMCYYDLQTTPASS